MSVHSPAVPPTRQALPTERLRWLIEQTAHLLPAQGPITVFIHHNTLHAYEELPFDQAVREGARTFGCHPWLPEDRYRQMFARGRIRRQDLVAVLRDDLGDDAEAPLPAPGTRLALRLGMLEQVLCTGPSAELRWFVAETDALQKFRPECPPAVREAMIAETRHWVMRDLSSGRPLEHRDELLHLLGDLVDRLGPARVDEWTPADWEAVTLQALWRSCRHGVHGQPAPLPPALPVRQRDLLFDVTGADSDLLVHDVLIRLSGAFCDQGVANWTLPRRNAGYWAAFCALYELGGGPSEHWLRSLGRELRRIRETGLSPLDVACEALHELGVTEAEWQEYLTATLLALRGWGGIMRQNEVRPDRVAFPAPAGTIVEFVAVRLLLERLALAYVAREELGFDGPLSELRDTLRPRHSHRNGHGVDQRAFALFQLAQVLGWSPTVLRKLSRTQWGELLHEVESFDELERRRIFHAAFERRFETRTLDAVALHARRGFATVDAPRVQALFCLDEREESIRRHLEEVAPDVETFGAAGFFCAAMYYKGAADAHFVPLCPVVIVPKHYVAEEVTRSFRDVHEWRAKARRMVGAVQHRVHVGSRTFTGGALLTMGLGVLASVPLVARVLFPKLAARFCQTAGRLLAPPAATRLELERSAADPGPAPGHLGFTVEEMAGVCERLLRDTGLTRGFARLVVLLGHGSTSLNNPHRSAYDCGACGGNHGHPNARAVSQMLNDPRVRDLLFRRGIAIPSDTVFVGGFHNTCTDSISFYDLDRLPTSHEAEFTWFEERLRTACMRNAHERCRRFMSAPLNLTFEAAKRHVEERSEDLGQTRPELGHATNALCIVGRRSRTRGLFLDRRAFLTSYDPTQDTPEAMILTRILNAIFPVCAGINLEYYFSHVDSAGWGCGTKLPHNVSALLGVMDGPASDLRTGLPWQMTEIHEPVRLLWVIETTPEIMQSIIDRNEFIRLMCVNEWVKLATLSPDSDVIHVYRRGRFEAYRPEAQQLPSAASSTDWYRGWRDHLEFAEVLSANGSAEASP